MWLHEEEEETDAEAGTWRNLHIPGPLKGKLCRATISNFFLPERR